MNGARRRWQPWVLGILGILLVGVIWELYKALMPPAGLVIGGVTVLPRSNDLAMPHLAAIWTRALEPTVVWQHGQTPWLVTVLVAAALSLGLAAFGWVLGTIVGLLLAMLMQSLRTAESALLPWIVLSQTVPLIAIAPLLKRWGSAIDIGGLTWENWMSVVVIASYLAFFPVSIAALRGFGAAEASQLDLMRAYGQGWWRTFLRVRLPNSVPHLLPALRLAAANAVVGAVVAEVSVGLDGGIGRTILSASETGSSDPAKVWVAILGAILVGLVAVGAVALIGVALRRYRRREVAS